MKPRQIHESERWPEDLYREKEARRKRLAALPIDERVKIIEFLKDEGIALRHARILNRLKKHPQPAE